MSTKLATAFLDRVQRSGLVSKDQMPQVRKALETRGVDLGSATAIANALVEQETLTRWQADKVLEGKHKGFFLGSYRLLRPLGKGGMGAVFLAQHEMMRRQCAIKVLPHSQIKEGSSVLKRFYVEAQAVAALDHQNIVRAYDVNREVKDGKEIHYLVMEFVEGHDIQTLVQEQGVLSYVKAAEYLRQTANGLTHAHENSLVHRDIKPANLLVDKKGVVKILDLGLARFFDDSEQASLTTTHNETVLGTADYLSPEQALNSHTVDHRTDIYSLGCTAYFMLTGHPPFPEGTVAQRLVAHQVKTPQPISNERPDAPADLLATVEKMMAKKPEDRFQSAEELSGVLARWLIEHGGDEWKRQHSEIVGDKTLMTLLSSREPTRAMSSPMSETELELAPLEDEDPEHIDMSPSRSGAKLGRSGSGTRKAGQSSATRGPSPATPDSVDQLAPFGDDEHEEVPAGQVESLSADSQHAPALEELGDAALLPSLDEELHDELEPLANLEEVDLASLDHSDMLGPLDDQRLTGAAGDSPLSVMESSLQQVVLSSSGSSASKSHRRGETAAAKPGPASVSSIGLPILIGGAGGLLLVLIILAVVSMMTQPDAVHPVVDPNGTVPQPDVVASGPGETSGQGTRPGDAPQGHPEAAGKRSAHPGDEAKPPVAPEKKSIEPKTPSVETQKPAIEPKQETARPGEPSETVVSPEPEPKPDEPPKTDVAVATSEEPKAADTTDGTKPKTPASRLTPAQRFAAIEGFKVNLDLTINGKSAQGGKPTSMTQFFQKVLLAAEREASESAGRIGLQYSVEQDPVLMLVLDVQSQPQGVLTLQGKMSITDEAGETVEVWSHDEELTKFTAQANQSTVYNFAREGIGRFFTTFRDDYQAVKGIAGNP